MLMQPFSGVRRDDVERLLQYIPFFRQIQQQDPEQFQVLLSFSKVSVLERGQLFLHAGSQDQWLYFLLRGELAVTVDRPDDEKIIVNKIQAGEVFGEIALILGQPRSADIRVAEQCRQATVFGLDFNAFGRLNDFSLIKLPIKQAFYRNVVHTLRWQLEVYRQQHPSHPLAEKHRRIKVLSLPKGGFEELQALHNQAVELATLLVEWNPSISNFGT
ncbi:cyclic nucleotide-binding domain-containing protein [Halioxenophilus sp. WMMB6]|uniref:cyclic nucleotide-binding domain-containing protein n=1 Tax=Halioxenophilus sp. WMMB6 TaxID=3073815 RepID=UPI00295E2F14|nr:cyclic nucleotide-binding domain-containing protein [Halioxenophilus sp. WMMB6]